jgi:MraZ protein
MFSGSFEHTLDDKGRLTVPSAFRQALQDGVVLRKDREGCVEILPRQAWQDYLERLKSIPRTDSRAQKWLTVELASATASELDKQGRVLLNQDQKVHAKLESGTVLVTGALDRLKVWNLQLWAKIQSDIKEEDLDEYIYQTYQI